MKLVAHSTACRVSNFMIDERCAGQGIDMPHRIRRGAARSYTSAAALEAAAGDVGAPGRGPARMRCGMSMPWPAHRSSIMKLDTTTRRRVGN